MSRRFRTVAYDAKCSKCAHSWTYARYRPEAPLRPSCRRCGSPRVLLVAINVEEISGRAYTDPSFRGYGIGWP